LDAYDAVERVARESYGRLLAFLSARSRDIAAAEDALADAFGAALANWPDSGVPTNPEAWLLTAARRKLVDAARRREVRDKSMPALLLAAEEAEARVMEPSGLADERLKLLFACAHPSIDAGIRTPLMLQTVLGLDASRIASAFCISPAAMARRLTRAKTRIREAGIPFEPPDPDALGPRLDSVLEAIYAAYGSGWDDVAGGTQSLSGLTGEAIYLGRLIVTLLPREPEARGLLALMLHCESRRAARRDARGTYVPLAEQNCALWSAPLAREAEEQLAEASRAGRIGRFQLEAAVQSVHAQRAVTGETDWEAVALLYEGLVRLAPTIGALVGRAAAVAEARGAEAGLALLWGLPRTTIETYQPYWALDAHLLAKVGSIAEAAGSYERAIGLCGDQAMRAFLIRKLEEIVASKPQGALH
jgi:RNA polymerase sigma-70 factor (ECF subfamily)